MPVARLLAVRGDVTREADRGPVDVVVNAADRELLGGGGVDGAVHAAAGPRLLARCRLLRSTTLPDGLAVGDAVATDAFDLAARWIVHTVGPDRRRGQRSVADLRSCFTRSLEVSADLGARRVAVPAVGAGVFGWDVEVVARTATAAVREFPGDLDEVVFVLSSARAERAFRNALDG